VSRVEFPDGKVENLGKPVRKGVVTDGEAFEVTKILRQNITGGTGGKTRENFTCPAAGKTGTTDDFKDAWFVGYTPLMATSVWVGYPNAGIEMRSVHGIPVAGGSFPALIWGKYMKKAQPKCKEFAKPKTAFESQPFSGKYAAEGKKHIAPVTGGDGKDKKKKDKKKNSGGNKDNGGGNGNGGGGNDPPPADPAPAPEPAPDNPGAVSPR
jgi:penicillin-binding protein 1A